MATVLAFNTKGRPKMPFRVLFQARANTSVEPPTYCKLVRKLPHMKESNVCVRIQTCDSSDGQLIRSERPNHLVMDG